MRLASVDKAMLGSIQHILVGGAARGINAIQTPRSFSLGRLARSLLKRQSDTSIGLLTGFPIVFDNGEVRVENDGPIGVGHLAMAFCVLGWRYRIISDLVANDMAAAINGVIARRTDKLTSMDPIVMAGTVDAAEQRGIVNRLAGDPTSHLIAIERPGRAKDGFAYNMRGQTIYDHIAMTEFLFDDQPWQTAAFADGGNEIGFGNIGLKRIDENIHLGRKIASRTKVDFLTLCGVSNWGAYGLVALLAMYAPKLEPLLMENFTPEFDQELFEAVRNTGAVDGVTKRPTATVDGLDQAISHEKIMALRDLVAVANAC